MPLNKPQLKANIKQFMLDFLSETPETETPDQAIDRFAGGLADHIDTYVRTGLVVTTGSASSQTGHIE